MPSFMWFRPFASDQTVVSIITFTTSNGVRHGGILSQLFLNVYMDKLSCTLNDAEAGCIMNGVYMNHLMYADDLVLIAPSMHAL